MKFKQSLMKPEIKNLQGSISLLMLFTAFTCSCMREEVIEGFSADLPFKPVVYCVLSPGDSIFLQCARAMTLGQNPTSVDALGIFNASVYLISQEGDSIELKLHKPGVPQYSASQQSFPIVAGANYKLLVKIGTSVYKATTTVPSAPVKWHRLLLTQNQKEEKSYQHVGFYRGVRGTWFDRPDEDIYYQVILTSEGWRKNLDTNEKKYYSDHRTSSIRTNLGGYAINKADSLYIYSDWAYLETRDFNENIIGKTTKHTFYLITSDKHLSSFMNASDVILDLKVKLDTDNYLELFRGITPEYSNIENGFGVFGSYLYDSLSLSF